MKYWVYLNGEVPGNYMPEELAAFPGFGDSSMVCPAEGGYEVRNWRHAGEFPDIASTLRQREKALPPAPAAMTAADAVREPVHSGTAQSPDDILNDASARIFRHVSELMKELENRREERALTQSLQRQAAELKNELLALRERNKFLQDRVDLIPGYETNIQKLQEQFAQAAADLSEKERLVAEQEQRYKALAQELEDARRLETKVSEDAERQVRLCEELSGQLASKEFTLARAFGLIRRLEAELSEILPGAVAGIRAELPEYPRAEEPRFAAPEPEIPTFRKVAPEPAAEEPVPVEPRAPEAPEPTVESVGEGSLATSDGDAPPLAEGEVRPVPAPWQVALQRAMGQVKCFLAPRPPK